MQPDILLNFSSVSTMILGWLTFILFVAACGVAALVVSRLLRKKPEKE